MFFGKKDDRFSISYSEFEEVKKEIEKLKQENNRLRSDSYVRELENKVKSKDAELKQKDAEIESLKKELKSKDFEIIKQRASMSAVLETLNETNKLCSIYANQPKQVSLKKGDFFDERG